MKSTFGKSNIVYDRAETTQTLNEMLALRRAALNGIRDAATLRKGLINKDSYWIKSLQLNQQEYLLSQAAGNRQLSEICLLKFL